MGTVKRLLPNTETEIFYNWDDEGTDVRALSITLTNTSASPVNVFVSFVELSGLFLAGSIFSNFTIAGYESIYKEIPMRQLLCDESIRAYASVPDVVALILDLQNVSQDLIDNNPAM